MVAAQVIGKATRDALFLSHFPVARLPLVLIVGSIVSSAVVWLTTRLVARHGPARVARLGFALQGILVLVEWALSARFEVEVAIVFYIQMVAVSATLLSAFWSVVGEVFDPHTAKQVIGRIGAGATLGGVVGGGIAWGASRVTTVPTMLGVMGVMSGVCTWSVAILASGTHASHARGAPAPRASGLTALRQTPYLRLLALIVLLGALVQALLDYALGAEAKATYGGGARLLAFFAIFQTAIGVLSFLVQLSANRIALDRLGVGRTMALLPGGVVALGAAVLGAPSIVTVALQRGAEALLRASLFRSAYEVLFTPVAPALKRPTKTMIDVSFDRVGLMAGSALTLGMIALFPHDVVRAVVLAAVLTAAIQLVVAYRLQLGYVETLADRLRSGELVLDVAGLVDATTRRTLSQTMNSLDRPTLLAKIEALRAAGGTHGGHTPAPEPIPEHPDLDEGPSDEVVRALVDLRSPDPDAIRRGLRRTDAQLLPLVVPILELLARDDIARDAARALTPLVPSILGTIADVVLDARRPASVRRRAARLLGAAPSQRAASALELALDADDLDVRYVCGRVLVKMRENDGDLRFDGGAGLVRARREIESRGEGRTRDARKLEHAFDVLSLIFPREPMQLAYGAVVADNPFLRGVALEYLDAVLPEDLRAALAERLEAPKTQRMTAAARPSSRALDDLLRSGDTIRLNLDELRREHDPDAGTLT
jgi:AAA family ATP:ADP antiporter